MIIVVMGVAGSGKSTIGKMLAERLLLPLIEADDFHSKENVLKMTGGIPLTDEDRYPWLKSLSSELQLHEQKKGAVLACSALKESYRQMLQRGLHENIVWIYLHGNETILKERIQKRAGHFMPGKLLQSQLDILEKPQNAYEFSIEKDPQTIVNDIIGVLEKLEPFGNSH